MRADAPLDVVVYGASGYTGRLVAEYLQGRYGSSLRSNSLQWALAGRNQEKLESLHRELGASEQCKILTADCEDGEALAAMAKAGKCVLTTAGPYQLYGAELVRQCAAHGTDYVDLCGEPLFMAEMIKEHAAVAKKNGARILFSCGFDSIPFDLGVQFVIYETQQSSVGGGPLTRVATRVLDMVGTFSGGTAASLTTTMARLKDNPELVTQLVDPFLLAQGKGVEQPAMSPHEDKDLGCWLAPFIMAPINTKCVHRSNELMGHPYGEEFQYDEMMIVADEAASAAQANPFGEKMPQPGEGPSKAEREAGFYKILVLGYKGKKLRRAALVCGDRDPGYGSTSKMISECALCLIESAKDLEGGIYTPAAALGTTLRHRLEKNAGLSFEVVGEGSSAARGSSTKKSVQALVAKRLAQ